MAHPNPSDILGPCSCKGQVCDLGLPPEAATAGREHLSVDHVFLLKARAGGARHDGLRVG